MDNREAVNWLINISADIGKAKHSDLWHYEQALAEIKDMLESAQPVATDINVGRTISRQQAIDALMERFKRVPTTAIIAKDVIENLPSVEPEPNTGHWVSQRGGGYCCSECGRYALDEVDGNFIHVAFKSNFCPYCGAHMKGVTTT